MEANNRILYSELLKKCGISLNNLNNYQEDERIDTELTKRLNEQVIVWFNEINQKANNDRPVNFEEYMSCDNDLSVSSPIDENFIVENTKACHKIEQPDQDNNDDDDEEPRLAPSRKQAIEALNLVRYFFECQPNETTSEIGKIDEV